MPKVRETIVRFGEVQYIPEIEPVPASSKTEGNVTINNMGSSGQKGYFDVSFMITAKVDQDDVEYSNTFSLRSVVTEWTKPGSYVDIEGAAADHLPTLLREMAQQIEDHSAKIAAEAEEASENS